MRLRLWTEALRIIPVMTVLATVMRSRRVWKHLVIRNIVVIHIVPGRPDNGRWAGAQIAEHCRHSDIDDIVAKASAIRPAPWNRPPAKSCLDLAGEHIPAKDAQPENPESSGFATLSSHRPQASLGLWRDPP